MMLGTINAVYAELRAAGYGISLRDLYELRDQGKLPMVNGKTTSVAVLKFYEAQLGISLSPKPTANQRPNTCCNGNESRKSRDRQPASRSNGQHQRAVLA